MRIGDNVKKSKKSNSIKHCELVAERYPVERIIRPFEMRQRLKVSRTTLYRWVKNGKFVKPVIKNNHAIGWKESDYLKWLNNVSY